MIYNKFGGKFTSLHSSGGRALDCKPKGRRFVSRGGQENVLGNLPKRGVGGSNPGYDNIFFLRES